MSLSRREVLAGGLGVAGAALVTCEARGEQEDPQIPEDAVVLVAQLKAKPGEEEAVKQALLAMVAPTRKEKGCICYNLHQSKTDKSLFAFYEQWTDQAAFDAHGKTPHMAKMRQAIRGKTASGGGVTFYDYLG
jgi:quinol monooxygenase YgiN